MTGIAPARSYTAPGPAKLIVQVDGTWETQRLLQERLLPAFKQRYRGIEVRLRSGMADLAGLRREAAAGATPDLFMSGASTVPALAGSLALPLDERIRTWGRLGDFYPASLTSSQWLGRQWGLPLLMEPRLHLWRKDILADTGIDRVPVTWEDVVDAARRATSVNAQRRTVVREGFPKPDGWSCFVAGIVTLGRPLFEDEQVGFTGPEGTSTMEYMLDLYQASRPPAASALRTNAAFPFATGAHAHTVGGLGALRALTLTWPSQVDHVVIGEPPVPAVPDDGAGSAYALPVRSRARPAVVLTCDFLAIGALSTARDQAWALLEYLLEPASLMAYDETRYAPPPRKSLLGSGFMRLPHLQRAAQMTARYGLPAPRVPEPLVFRNTLRDAAEEMYRGRLTAEQAVARASRLLQAEAQRVGFKGSTT